MRNCVQLEKSVFYHPLYPLSFYFFTWSPPVTFWTMLMPHWGSLPEPCLYLQHLRHNLPDLFFPIPFPVHAKPLLPKSQSL